MVDSYVTACKDLAAAVAEGVYGDHDFIAIPRPPSDSEGALNGTSNFVWPDLYFLRAADGTEAVYVKIASDFIRYSSPLRRRFSHSLGVFNAEGS